MPAGRSQLGRLSVFLDMDIRQFVAKMQTTKASLKGLSGTIQRNSAAFKAMGRRMLIAGTAVTAAVVGVVKAAGDMEHAMLGVRKTTGYAGEQLVQLRDNFEELSTVIPVSAEELASIGEVAGLLGIRGVDNITKFTEVAAKMAVATKFTAEEAALQLAKISNAFDEPIENAERLGSTINELSNTTAANSIEIADSMRRMAPGARILEITAAEAAGLAATMVELGMRARRVGTRFNMVYTLMAKNVDKLAKVIGIPEQKMAEIIEEDALVALTMFMKKVDELPGKVERIQIMNEVFGTSAAKVTTLLSTELGRMTENLTIAERAWKENISLQQEFENMMTGTWNILATLRNEFMLYIRDIGEDFLPMIKQDLIPTMKEMLKHFGEFVKTIKDAPPWVRKLALAAGPLLIVLGGLALILPALATGLAALGPVGLTLIGVLIGIAANFDRVRIGLTLLMAGFTNWFERTLQGFKLLIQASRLLFGPAGFIGPMAKQIDKAITHIDNKIKEVHALQEGLTDEAADLMENNRKRQEEYKKLQEQNTEAVKEEIKKQKEELSQSKEDIEKHVEFLEENVTKMEGLIERAEKTGDIGAKNAYEEMLDIYQRKLNESKMQLQSFVEANEESVNKVKDKHEETADETGEVWTKTTNGMKEGLRGAIRGAMMGELTSFEDFATAIFERIRSAFADAIADMIVSQLKFNKAASEAPMGAGGSGGGFLSGIANILGGLFGFFGGGVADPAGGLGGGYTGSGTPYPGGYSNLGFQHGTEFVPATGLYQLHEGEKVIPRTVGAEGGGPITIINMISPDFIGEAIRKNENIIINPITSNLLRNGRLRKTIKET